MCRPTTLTLGHPVPDPECWFRVLTNKKHVTRDGTVHHQALKGNAFAFAGNKAWTHELSGRLVCLANDIVIEAEFMVSKVRQGFRDRGESVPSDIRFMGVACATAHELRHTEGCVLQRDVMYTPLPEDSAHSDFVTFATATSSDLEPVCDWLIKLLRVVRPENIDHLVTSCGMESNSGSPPQDHRDSPFGV